MPPPNNRFRRIKADFRHIGIEIDYDCIDVAGKSSLVVAMKSLELWSVAFRIEL
jgi:hypothetical protein